MLAGPGMDFTFPQDPEDDDCALLSAPVFQTVIHERYKAAPHSGVDPLVPAQSPPVTDVSLDEVYRRLLR